MEINVTYENVEIKEFTVKSEDQQYSLNFEFSSSRGNVKAKLSGIRDADNLCELLHADRIWVRKESESQVEFGRYTLGISHESYSEVIFDALS